MLKRTYLSLIVSTLLPISAMSAVVEVPAVGKTEDVAVKKANLNAVRSAMIELRGKQFLQDHSKEIRNNVILKIDDFITSSEVVSSSKNDKGNYEINARVDVNSEKLSGVLAEISGEPVKTAASDEKTDNTEVVKSDKPETPESPEVAAADKPETPESPEAAAADKPETPENPEAAAADKPETPENPEAAAADKQETPESPEAAAADKPETPENPEAAAADKPETPENPEPAAAANTETPDNPEPSGTEAKDDNTVKTASADEDVKLIDPVLAEEDLAYLASVKPAEIKTVEDTRKYFHIVRNKVFVDLTGYFKDLGLNSVVKLTPDEKIDDSHDSFQYKYFVDDQETFSAKLTSTYAPGKVDSELTVSDSYFEGLDLGEKLTPIVKDLVNSSKHQLDLASDIMESVFSLKEGEFEGFKWKPSQFVYKNLEASQPAAIYDAYLSVPEITGDAGRFMLSGLGIAMDNKELKYSFNSALKNLKVGDEEDALIIDNFVHNFTGAASEGKKANVFDLKFSSGVDQLSETSDDDGYSLKNTNVSFYLKNLDLAQGLKICGMDENKPFSYTAFSMCLMNADQKPDYQPIKDNPFLASYMSSRELGYGFAFNSGYMKLGNIAGVDLFDVTGLKFATDSAADRFSSNAEIEKAEYNDSDNKLTVSNLSYGLAVTPDASSVRNNYDLSLNITLGNLLMNIADNAKYEPEEKSTGDEEPARGRDKRHIIGYDYSGNRIELTVSNLNLDGIAGICGVAKDDHLSVVSTFVCVAEHGDELLDAAATMIRKNTTVNLNSFTKMGGSPVSLTASLSVDQKADESSPDSIIAGLNITADLKLDKEVLSKEQYGLQELSDMAVKYAKDPEAAEYEFHIVYQGGELKINDKPAE